MFLDQPPGLEQQDKWMNKRLFLAFIALNVKLKMSAEYYQVLW